MPEADMPEWCSQEERGIEMEIVTAAAVLASGSDAVIMRHPEAIRTIAAMIGELVCRGKEEANNGCKRFRYFQTVPEEELQGVRRAHLYGVLHEGGPGRAAH